MAKNVNATPELHSSFVVNRDLVILEVVGETGDGTDIIKGKIYSAMRVDADPVALVNVGGAIASLREHPVIGFQMHDKSELMA